MEAKEYTGVLEDALLGLKEKIETEQVVSRQDVTSLEEYFKVDVLSKEINVSMLSSAPSSFGADVVIEAIDKYFTNFQVSQEHCGYLEKLELKDDPVKFIEEFNKFKEHQKEKEGHVFDSIKAFLNSKLAKNIVENIISVEADGKFFRIQDLPPCELEDVETSTLYLLSGNDDAEYAFNKDLADRIDDWIDKGAEIFHGPYKNPLFTLYHDIYHNYKNTYLPTIEENANKSEIYHQVETFAKNVVEGEKISETSNIRTLGYFLVMLYLMDNICPCGLIKIYKQKLLSTSDLNAPFTAEEKNKLISESYRELRAYMLVFEDLDYLFKKCKDKDED